MNTKIVRTRRWFGGFAVLCAAILAAGCSLLGLGDNVPAAPTGVTLSAAIATVTVSWNSVAGATSYTVYDTNDGTVPSASNYEDENSPTGTTTTLTYTPSTPGSLTVVVTASNDNGEGGGSTPQTISTITPTGVSSTTPVWNSAANSGAGGYQMTISWNSVAGANGYYVYHTYGASPGQPSEANVGNGTTESNEITGKVNDTFTMGHDDPAGNKFYFAVAAVDGNGNTGALSATPVEVTVPAAP